MDNLNAVDAACENARFYYGMECPECGDRSVPGWNGFDGDDASYCCVNEECGEQWDAAAYA